MPAAARLATLDDRTLKVLVESGAWITSDVAGPEVDVTTLLPLPLQRAAPVRNSIRIGRAAPSVLAAA